MLLELLAVLAATCAVLYYRFRRKCSYWYAIINKYNVFASFANILPKYNGRPLPASLPKSPHFTRKRCRLLTDNNIICYP